MASASASGFLIIDKPAGCSSAAVVARIRRMLPRGVKVGHGGTLDPFATGVLPILVGREATRLARWFLECEKEYSATLLLGTATDTLDCTGRVVHEAPVPVFEPALLTRISGLLVGELAHEIPAFAATREEGKHRYLLARKGLPVRVMHKTVTIRSFQATRVSDVCVAFQVQCEAGTYVRSLGAMFARRLGTVGHLTSLVRVRSGPFVRKDAIPLSDIGSDGDVIRGLISPPTSMLESGHASFARA